VVSPIESGIFITNLIHNCKYNEDCHLEADDVTFKTSRLSAVIHVIENIKKYITASINNCY
jgi:hypothetical protein